MYMLIKRSLQKQVTNEEQAVPVSHQMAAFL